MACNQTSEGAHAGAPVEWGYSGEGGPATWGSLSDKYSSCSEGKRQSPVDIAGYLPGDASALSFTYSRDGRYLTNTGKLVKVTHGNSRMRLQEREYTLIEVHSHNPSEHSIDGKSFALELHLVHRGESGEIAVVGVLYRPGEENPAIQAMIDAAPQPSETVEPASPLGTQRLPSRATRPLQLFRLTDDTAMHRRRRVAGNVRNRGGVAGTGQADCRPDWRRNE